MGRPRKKCIMCERLFGRLFTESGAEYDERKTCRVKCNVLYRKEMQAKDPDAVVAPFSRAYHSIAGAFSEEFQ